MKKERFVGFLTSYLEKISLNITTNFFCKEIWVTTLKRRLAEAI